MRKSLVIILLLTVVFISVSFSKENLRDIYSRPPAEWPAPFVAEGVQWKELGILPRSPLDGIDSLKDRIALGKMLFFDTRLSSSGKISCASCHQPELYWTDGKQRSEGHEGAMNKRNAPTLQNVWFYDRLFWDGRAKDLQDQAFAPINSETEMHSDMPEVIEKLRYSKAYPGLFKKAFGEEGIDPDKMTLAIATFEKTITGRKSRFDAFLTGDRNALTDSELRGLDAFRTRAGCFNCHNGPLLTDNQFHHNEFSQSDEGLFKVTHEEEDKYKFKTPSLRDIIYTGPWMHDGVETDLFAIIDMYLVKNAPHTKNPLLKSGKLKSSDVSDIAAFLKAISARPAWFEKPVLPE